MSKSLLSQLGVDKIQTKSGEVALSSLAGKSIMLYFSAHWCPPCRGFTPKLAEYYTKHKDKKNFEIIFVSSDKNAEAFDEYYGEQPWLALPFAERDLKAKLSSEFKVSGIPGLVVLEADTHALITDKGRDGVSSDPDCENFPWTPKTLAEITQGLKLVDNKGTSKTFADLQADPDTVIGIYFSAHWCPPCKAFTPKLVETYNKVKAAGKKFEIIFASSDRNQEAFDEYFAEMPWLAVNFTQRAEKEELSTAFDVEGIPSLMILGADLSVIAKDGRSAVGGDPEGAEFPWHPKPLNDLSAGFGEINEKPSLIAFCNVDDAEKAKVIAAMKDVSKEHWDEQKSAGDDPKFAFFTASDGDANSGRIRGLVGVEDGVQIVVVDIPGGGKAFTSKMSDVTPASLKEFMSSYKTSEGKKLF